MTRIRFTHSNTDEPEQPAQSSKLDTPQSTKDMVRKLIEVEGYYSTTEIADRLNGFLPGQSRPTEGKMPRATGFADWTAADVSSLLRSGKMEDLKAKLVANRPKPEEAPTMTGVSPLVFRQALADDLGVLLKEQTKILGESLKGAGGASDLGGVAAKLAELSEALSTQPSAPSLAAIKVAIADTLTAKLKTQPQAAGATPDSILDKVVADTADEVCAVFEKVIEKSDLPAVHRMSKAAAENVGEICKKIDDLTAGIYDEMKTGLADSSTLISEIVVEHVEGRFAAFMTQVNEKVQAAIDEKLGDTITESVAKAFGGIQSSHAVQIAHFEKKVERLEKALDDMIDKKVTVRLDRIGDRLKRLEDAEEEWNDS
jgi:hypothetical protein